MHSTIDRAGFAARRLFHPLLLATLVSITQIGCGDKAPQAHTSSQDSAAILSGTERLATDAPASTTPSIPERPATKVVKIMIKGEAHPTHLTLLNDEIPFTTYIPDDMTSEKRLTPEGIEVTVYANFNGKENKDAYLQIFIPTKKTSPIDATGTVLGSDGPVEKNGWKISAPPDPFPRCPWAYSSYLISGKKGRGYICIGIHHDKAFHVLLHRPEKYAEDFDPRADLILSEFRWNDGKGIGEE